MSRSDVGRVAGIRGDVGVKEGGFAGEAMRKEGEETRALDAPCCAELNELDEREIGHTKSVRGIGGSQADEQRLRMKEVVLEGEAMRKLRANTRALDAPC